MEFPIQNYDWQGRNGHYPLFFNWLFFLIFAPMEDMCKEKTCAKYLRKISIFQEVMNKRNLKREIRVNGFWERGKNLKIMGFFLHDWNNMTIKGAKIQAKISTSGGEMGICSLGVNHIQLTNYVKLVHQILLTDYSSFS